jgi:hypothetical protein
LWAPATAPYPEGDHKGRPYQPDPKEHRDWTATGGVAISSHAICKTALTVLPAFAKSARKRQ